MADPQHLHGHHAPNAPDSEVVVVDREDNSSLSFSFCPGSINLATAIVDSLVPSFDIKTVGRENCVYLSSFLDTRACSDSLSSMFGPVSLACNPPPLGQVACKLCSSMQRCCQALYWYLTMSSPCHSCAARRRERMLAAQFQPTGFGYSVCTTFSYLPDGALQNQHVLQDFVRSWIRQTVIRTLDDHP